VYGCVISACKRADPPQVDRAVLVLDEMIASDVPVTVATYNAVLDCCRVGGSWRRGVQIFESMTTGGPTQAGVKPNTNTYSIMAKLGYEAKNDDPGEIYTALKYAGVPEYIAYSSAASNALKVDKTRGVKGGGRSLEEELDLLEFIEVPVVKRRDGDTAGAVARVQEQARDIEKAVDRILKVGGKGLLDGEDDRTVSTVTASVRYREEDVGAEVRTVESNKTVI
jgi:pentatricopeptide repeat protein